MSKVEERQMAILELRRENIFEEEVTGPPVWLISFTDVIALMLTFFVLLYAMSDTDPERFEDKMGVTAYAEAQFDGAGNKAGNDEGENINRLDYRLAEDLQYLEALFRQALSENNVESLVEVTGEGDTLMIYLHPTLLLNNRQFLLFLNQLEPILESLDNRIELVGHVESIDVFRKLQTLGRILESYGYDNPVSLTLHDMDDAPMQSHMAIGIRSNDGRRLPSR